MKLVEKLNVQLRESVKDAIKAEYGCTDADFEKASPEHSVCSIAKTKNGWVGYSHRASCEFTPKKGAMIFDIEWDDNGRLSQEELDSMPFNKRGDKPCKTQDDAKISAINFAKLVS